MRKSFFCLSICFAPFLSAQIEHQGVVGGPFHGYLEDSDGQARVQVGPVADFSVPSGLSARATQNRISSGGSSPLSASIVLDDGTYTTLDPSQVEWSFSKPHLTVDNGTLLAEVMPKRTSIRVRASAEGFQQSFTIFILADDGLVAEEAEASLPEVLRSAIELEAKRLEAIRMVWYILRCPKWLALPCGPWMVAFIPRGYRCRLVLERRTGVVLDGSTNLPPPLSQSRCCLALFLSARHCPVKSFTITHLKSLNKQANAN